MAGPNFSSPRFLKIEIAPRCGPIETTAIRCVASLPLLTWIVRLNGEDDIGVGKHDAAHQLIEVAGGGEGARRSGCRDHCRLSLARLLNKRGEIRRLAGAQFTGTVNIRW